MYYTYLLESRLDESWYIGFSSDLKERLKRHNNGENISTKSKRPWIVIYYEAYLDRRDAEGRERFLKSGSRRKFLKKQLAHYLS